MVVEKERKYRQDGYQNETRDQESPDKPRGERGERPKRDRNTPREYRAPRMPAFHEVSRCSACGGILSLRDMDVVSDSLCPFCSAELHVCKNCVSFDTSSRFECRQEIRMRVPRKDKNNDCEFFELRRSLERQTGSTPAADRPATGDDAREAFERLFRKI